MTMAWPSRSLFKKLARKAGFFFLISGLSACATYQGKVSVARDLLTQGQADEAVKKLEPLAQTADGDQLVYLLDYATALQIAGQIKESNKAYLKADKLSEEQDYHSVSRLTGSMLLNEEMKQYKGDTFEKIFINAQLALNFLKLGQHDDGLVEARRINQKYQKLRADDDKKSFELNPFAKYLSAVLWEADRSYDDAIIAYEEAYKISPMIEPLPEDLIRLAKLSKREDSYNKWKAQFPNIKEKPDWYDKSKGELIVIVEQGWGPRKIADPIDGRWPLLSPVYNQTQKVRAEIPEVGTFESRFVYDVQSAAMKTLADDRASLLARRLAGIAAKAVAADQIRQKNEILVFAAWVAMRVSDRADLRQWSTLPQSIQFVRVFLKPGVYPVALQGLDGAGAPTGDRLEGQNVTIKAGKKSFVVWRTLR